MRRPWAIALLTLTLAGIFVIDRATPVAPLQHLYYLPIFLAASWFGWSGGLITAASAVVLYHLANPSLVLQQYKDTDFVQIALFIAVGLVTAKLMSDRRQLRRLAMTDDLTGLHNLRSFEAAFETALRDACQDGEPLALLLLDVDRLKSLNDTYGHLTGAEAVRTVGDTLASHLPPDAIACRYGGDEFAAVLPGCTEADANQVAERLREAVQATEPVLAGRTFDAATLSISVGLAYLDPHASTPHDYDRLGLTLFRTADRALYRAKGEGRNRVQVA